MPSVGRQHVLADPFNNYLSQHCRYGTGDYRIPLTALTTVDGSKIDINTKGKYKGVVMATDGNGERNSDRVQVWSLDHCLSAISVPKKAFHWARGEGQDA